jgi:hypothetical protein
MRMRSHLEKWSQETGWVLDKAAEQVDRPQLALCFASKAALAEGCTAALKARHPEALVAACSTGGEILGRDVHVDAAAAALVRFDKSRLATARAACTAPQHSFAAGESLARQLQQSEDLRGVIVLADGLHVNGAKLVEGLRAVLGDAVVIVGGLAGDGADFKETCVGLDIEPAPQELAAIGLYGEDLALGSSSFGGWDAFGPERQITKADGSVLYELDGQPALALYKRYLGEEAANLPASALLFPLAIRRSGQDAETLTRTIVGVDEEAQSLTFAGEMPQGWSAQLMRGTVDRIVSGAADAAQAAGVAECQPGQSLGILISCIGRRLMLGQRVQEEVEAVGDEWPGVPVVGFYSYGEIGPHGVTGRCTLHNQTMTALLVTER